MKNKLLIFGTVIIILLTSCYREEDKITIKRVLVEKVIKLPLPKSSVISANKIQIVKENGKTLLFVYFFPQNKIFVYDLDKKTLIHDIPIYRNLAGIDNFRYVNKDSIWVFGSHSSRYNYDSSLVVVNYNGLIKHIYPFYHNYFISLKTCPDLYNDSVEVLDENALDTVLFAWNYLKSQNLVLDNKIFFSTKAGHIGSKSHLPHLPIIGYYDLNNKEVKLNNRLYYPFLDDGIFYPTGSKYYYYPIYSSISHNNSILLSFCYTPWVIEWDYKHNSVDTHKISSQLIDTIYPYTKPINFDTDTTSIYYNMYYVNHLKMYLRFAMLSNNYENKRMVIFSDTNFNYLGEAIIEIDEMPQYIFDNNFISSNIVGDSLILKFFKYEFSPLKIMDIKKYLDSINVAIIEKREKDVCAITGEKGDTTYTTESLFRYLNYFDVNDSSYALIILSKDACHSCNDYVANTISMNQHVFFNLTKKPFYLLYEDNNGTVNDVKNILKQYNFGKYRNIKIDTTDIYKYFNPFDIWNPRMILVENKKIISDTVYMPQNLENLVERLLSFYGLETE